jgi:hypothetical protein
MLQLKSVVSSVAMLLVFCTVPAAAETSPPTAPAGAVGNPSQGAPQKPPEPSVFDLQSKPGPITTKSAATGTERFVGSEPEYNTEQRAKWLETCEPRKAVDYNAYRECYQNEKKKSAAAVRESIESTERRLNGSTYRNSAPRENTPDAQPRNPAFDVQVESTKE